MNLYIVRVVREAYVLAESEDDAVEQQREMERWEDYPTIECYEAGEEKLAGWDDTCQVYHSGEGDMTLGEARAAAELGRTTK